MKSKNRTNVLDLNHVFLFVEVVRANSFAAAARRLGMPANSVSRKIQELEAQVGTRLIHRSTRKLTLTAAGRTFFDRCAGPVSELAQAGQASVDETQLPSGVVRVAAPADFFDLFPIEWVAQFMEDHPRVRMEFVLDDAKADLVGEGIDVALRAAHFVDDNLIGQKIVATHFELVASPSYLEVNGTPPTLAALTGHDCLPQSNRTGPVTWVLVGPDGETEIEVSSRFRANTSRAVQRAAVAGLGIALLPHPVIAADLAAGRLVRVLPEFRRDGADFYAVYVSRRHIPRAVSAFIEFAVERVRRVMATA
jgi:DNA-binding transcriptional LysR family regulator